MGWEISASNPGMALKVSSIFSISSGVVLAEVHSAFGFSAIMMSARSTGIGSVGISALPIRLTTCLISGYSFLSSFSVLLQLSTICDNEVPCDILISTAKSPSSRLGMNSPPRYLKPTILTQKRATAPVMTSLLRAKTQSRTGRYHACNFSITRSENVFRVCTFRLNISELAIGT